MSSLLRDATIFDHTDSYKESQAFQLPGGISYMQSYVAPRGGKHRKVMLAGAAYVAKLISEFTVTKEQVQRQADLMKLHGEPFNEAGWMYIVDHCKGKLPLRIRSLPEGSVFNNNGLTCPVVVSSTDPNCVFVVDYVETMILRYVWSASTTATTSWMIRNQLRQYCEETGSEDPETSSSWMLQDFGFRGVSSFESGAVNGVPHLYNFQGTDTKGALLLARNLFGVEMAGYSIAASQHSTMTMLGSGAGEVEQMRNMIRQFGERGIFACVCDGFDVYKAARDIWGTELRQELLDSEARLVFRPDSGDPLEVLPRLFDIFEQQFGGITCTKRGYKLLHPQIRILWGDGLDLEKIYQILQLLKSLGWAAENMVFGMGGALLQNHTRDDDKWAMKCCAVMIHGLLHKVRKDPITDPGKKSLSGFLDTIYCVQDDTYKTVNISHPNPLVDSALVDIYLDGQYFDEHNKWEMIKKRASAAR